MRQRIAFFVYQVLIPACLLLVGLGPLAYLAAHEPASVPLSEPAYLRLVVASLALLVLSTVLFPLYTNSAPYRDQVNACLCWQERRRFERKLRTMTAYERSMYKTSQEEERERIARNLSLGGMDLRYNTLARRRRGFDHEPVLYFQRPPLSI